MDKAGNVVEEGLNFRFKFQTSDLKDAESEQKTQLTAKKEGKKSVHTVEPLAFSYRPIRGGKWCHYYTGKRVSLIQVQSYPPPMGAAIVVGPQAAAPSWGRCRLICPEFTSRNFNFERRSIVRVVVGSQSSELSGSRIEDHFFEICRDTFSYLCQLCAQFFFFLAVSWVILFTFAIFEVSIYNLVFFGTPELLTAIILLLGTTALAHSKMFVYTSPTHPKPLPMCAS